MQPGFARVVAVGRDCSADFSFKRKLLNEVLLDVLELREAYNIFLSAGFDFGVVGVRLNRAQAYDVVAGGVLLEGGKRRLPSVLVVIVVAGFVGRPP